MKTILAAIALCLLTACATIRPGNQSAEVRAEQTLSVSLAALDSFITFEHRRSADVPALVRDVARRIRSEAPKALDSANNLRLAYKSNRTAANEANLFTALAVVDSMLAEIRVWVPATSASGPDNRVVDRLIREAAASKTVTAQSWTVLVPVFIDLAREIYAVVNRTREAVKQDMEWSLQQNADFAAKLAGLKTAPHWRL
jgi:outer membrane biogenesis lipoprotein LolB